MGVAIDREIIHAEKALAAAELAPSAFPIGLDYLGHLSIDPGL